MEHTNAPPETPGDGGSTEPPETRPYDIAPTFSGEQVAFLLRNLTIPGQQEAATTPSPGQKARARGGYNASFGWMHLTSPETAIKLVLGAGLLILGFVYVVQGLTNASSATLNVLASLQPVLLIVLGALFLVHTIVKWRRSHLYTTTTQVVYAVKPFWPLLILRIEQRAQLPKIDASVYSQNALELMFRMNSGTLTIDTAAQGDRGLHHLKGVKDIELLRKDIE